MISTKKNMPTNQQRLIFQGKVLQNDTILSDYNVQADCVLHLVSMPQPNTQPRNEPQIPQNQSPMGPEMMMNFPIGGQNGLDLNNV
jgi:hypothetical protein